MVYSRQTDLCCVRQQFDSSECMRMVYHLHTLCCTGYCADMCCTGQRFDSSECMSIVYQYETDLCCDGQGFGSSEYMGIVHIPAPD